MVASFPTTLRLATSALVVTAALLVAQPRSGEAVAGAQQVPATRMYRMNNAATALAPMDALTLTDMKGAPSIRLIPKHGKWPQPQIISNPRGTALAALFYTGPNSDAKGLTIRVIDVRTGKARDPMFHPELPMWISGISADGSELYGTQQEQPLPGAQPMMQITHYYVLSSSTGHVLRMSEGKAYCCGPILYDSARQRLYSMITAHADDPKTASQVPELMAQDLQTGQELGSLSLPSLHAGSWKTNRQVDGFRLIRAWAPGVALSPDGRQIAIVDGSNSQLTLVDTASLRIIRTVTLSHPESLLERIGSWLGLIPEAAYAKGEEGVSLYAWYSPDGNLLYVSGTQGSVTKKNTFAWTYLGVRVVDINSGTIVAERFHGKTTSWSGDLSPDGTSLYIAIPETQVDGGMACPCSLQRLDARTLRTLAIRRSMGPYGGGVSFYFLAPPKSE